MKKRYVSPLFGRTRPRFQKGVAGYARLLIAVMRGARSQNDLESIFGINGSRAIEFMLRLRSRRLVHVGRWTVSVCRRGSPTPYFSWGGQADAELPRRHDGTPRRPSRDFERKVRVSSEQLAFMLAIEALQKGATREELGESSGLSHGTVKTLLAALRAGHACYVCDWRFPNGRSTPVHALCTPLEPHVDVPKLKPPVSPSKKLPQIAHAGIYTEAVRLA